MTRVLSRLGEDVAFTHAFATTPATVRGVFMSPYRAAELGIVGVSGTDPVFSVMSSVIGAVSPNDIVVRGGVTYKVKAVRPDDPSGVVHLELKRT
jgi:hypothetical protein